MFHYNQPNIITSLDPAYAKTQNNYWAVDHIFNQLLDISDSLEFIPELALKFSVSHDGRTYTFNLRTDVWFHQDSCFGSEKTRKMTSMDVAYSFKRLMSKELNAPGRWVFAGKVDSILPFEVVNDSVFSLHLKEPYAPILSLLTMHYCSILPQEAVDFYQSKFAEHPVGTGPFCYKKWAGKQGLFLAKNCNYFKKGKPLLDGVRISFIEDRNTAYLEFKKKNIDFFSGLQSSFALQVIDHEGKIREDRKYDMNLTRGPYLNTEYIGIYNGFLDKDHPLNNKKFRQALNYAIDKRKMIQTFKYGVGTAAESGFIPAGLPSYDPTKVKGYVYNPILAKSILAEIHYKEKFRPQDELVLNTNKDYIDLITYIARQWQEIGIVVRIELHETASLREKMRSGSLSLFRASWIADYPDEESFLNFFYGPNPCPPNYTRFDNHEYNLLYQLAIRETQKAKRQELYQKMDQILIEESPVIFLFYDQIALLSQNNIKGIVPNSINLLRLETVEKINR